MKSKLKIFDEIVSWILLVAVTICLIFSLYSVYEAKTTGEPAFLFGYRPVFVLTGSMEPYMMTNSVVITKEVDSMDDIAVGDVVTYHVENEEGKTINITHRIVEIDENGIINTKGDNNFVNDDLPLTIENVDAKVVTVFNQTAWIVAKWQTTAGKIMLISFAVAIVLLFITIRFGLSTLAAKKEENDESAKNEGDELAHEAEEEPLPLESDSSADAKTPDAPVDSEENPEEQ